MLAIEAREKENDDPRHEKQREWEKVLVEKWLDYSIHFSLRGHYLKYILLPKRPEKIKRNPTIITTHKLNYKPPPNHPWRKLYKAKS